MIRKKDTNNRKEFLILFKIPRKNIVNVLKNVIVGYKLTTLGQVSYTD